MEWIAFSIAFLGVIYFSIHDASFRKWVFILLGASITLGTLGMVALIYRNEKDSERYRENIDRSRNLIRKDQIVLIGPMLSIGAYSQLSGDILNESSYKLKSVSFRVTVADCVSSEQKESALAQPQPTLSLSLAGCEIIGQDVVEMDTLDIPAGQKRAFSGSIRFDNMPKVERMNWNLEVTEVVAAVDGQRAP